MMVRYEAAQILGKARAKTACDALIAAYHKEKNSEAREAIVAAMGRIKDEKALPVLRAAVENDPDEQVRIHAQMAICNIEGTDYEETRLKRQEKDN